MHEHECYRISFWKELLHLYINRLFYSIFPWYLLHVFVYDINSSLLIWTNCVILNNIKIKEQDKCILWKGFLNPFHKIHLSCIFAGQKCWTKMQDKMQDKNAGQNAGQKCRTKMHKMHFWRFKNRPFVLVWSAWIRISCQTYGLTTPAT